MFARKRRLTPEQYEAEQNAQSIREIPRGQLPDDEARAELVRRALVVRDVYAYRPAFGREYVVWVRQPSPAMEARYAPMEWARQWRAGLQPERGGAA